MQKKAMVLTVSVLEGIILVGSSLTMAQSSKRALELYNEKQSYGLMCRIELAGGGLVPEDHIFRTGDRIKLHLQANFQGYVYVISEGPSGQTVVLFPARGAQYAVAPGTDYAVPQGGWFQFSPPAGLEKLTVILSRSPIQPLANALTQSSSSATQPPAGQQSISQSGSLTIINDPELDAVIDELASRALKRGRDLVFTEDLPNNNQVYVYPTSSMSESVAFSFVLTHSN